ncbi:unnamed protein product [Aureobasidium mustum]|uniref:Uncharacterized protein n=1 Tax=Aureobasidium mustum TaxID=2773714 RepID=A0A9N8JQQ5_9PEZI|nr:unnamed protein product [Aureobasidium mustum]
MPNSSNISPNQFVSFLQSLPALRRLNLLNVKADTMEKFYAWEGVVVAQLEELSIDGSCGFRRDLELRNHFLNHCTGLRKIDLDRGHPLSADALVHLSGLASLEDLSLSH